MQIVIFTVLCAFVAASPADRQKRDDSNPCTRDALAAHHTYFANSGDKNSFIECDLLGHANVMPCPSSLVWDESRLSCVYEFTTQTGSGSGTDGGSVTGTENTTPAGLSNAALMANCSPENIAANKLFHPHPDPTKFIQCDLWGDVYVASCPAKLVWNSKVEACDSAFLPFGK